MTNKKDHQIVTVRLPERVQEAIGAKVKDKTYMNRSDFLRTAIRNQLEKDGLIVQPF